MSKSEKNGFFPAETQHENTWKKKKNPEGLQNGILGIPTWPFPVCGMGHTELAAHSSKISQTGISQTGIGHTELAAHSSKISQTGISQTGIGHTELAAHSSNISQTGISQTGIGQQTNPAGTSPAPSRPT